jgi:dipeptidyl aminopeptidase/acylaminoacyl peptidase
MEPIRKEISNLSHKGARPYVASILVLLSSLAWAAPKCNAQQRKKPFTVSDEIGLTLFDDQEKAVAFSPDGKYFVAYSERGRLDLNRPEDSLRFYRSVDIQNFLALANESRPPSPMWVVNLSTDRDGPIINDWRWLSDSSGVTFLERTSHGNRQLFLADLGRKTVGPLTSAAESVQNYDVGDRQHYVYTIADQADREKMKVEPQAPAIVGTGHSLFQLLLPKDPVTKLISSSSTHLWASVGGKRFEVKNDGLPIAPDGRIAFSPDGSSVVTRILVPEFPSSWEVLYPPPFASDPYRMRAGSSVHQYVRIDIQTGSVRSLTDAPVSSDAGSWASVFASPSWSRDGQAVVLPDTFIKSAENAPSRPCVAVVNIASGTRTCVEMLRGHTETGAEKDYHLIENVRFAGAHWQRVLVISRSRLDSPSATSDYRYTAEGTWQLAEHSASASEVGNGGLEVMIRQAFNEPPQLVATDKNISRVIWDPNPQLKNIELGEATVYTWKDNEGRNWRGGLYKPSNYDPTQRYPLVIQTHGFPELGFRPSGVFPTAFAARALAAVGIVVLQAGFSCPVGTTDEGPCAVSGYETGASQLVSQGLVDPEKIGVIGFSRTCFYVMKMLTTGSVRLRAASITDGWMVDYSQYMLEPERLSSEGNSMIGVAPFGEGLQKWLKLSPSFNLDKVTSPLLVVGEGPLSLLFMWEPYAGLHYLGKPVDLVMLNTDEHVLTNPAVRMASQGGSVDWFRFWLQDYEDPDPAKADQYKRWRELRKLQEQN